MEDIRKELRLTRFFCILSSFLTVCLLAAAGFLYMSLRPVVAFIEEAEPALEQMSGLDVDALNASLQQVDSALGQVDWEELAGSLEELDVDAVNEVIHNLDTQELSVALEHLNSAIDTLEALGEKFRSFTALFGR